MPLAASVFLHAAVLAFIATRTPPPSLPRFSAPLEIQFVEKAPEVTPQPVVEQKPEPVVAAPKPIVRSRPKVVAQQPVVETAPPQEEQPPVVREMPIAEDMPRAKPNLVPQLELGGDGPAISDFPVIVKPGIQTPQEMVQNLVSDTISKGKVERGLVHPYYQEVGKVLLKNWDADRAVEQHGLKGYVEQFSQNTAVWQKAWTERAAEFAKTGSPLGREEYLNPERPVVGDKDLYARKQIAMKMREQFKNSKRALIRVTQDATGRLVAVELVQPSNDPNVDKEALTDVRTAAEKLPPPPPDAVGSRSRLVSIWQFELIVSISPPVPSFSFEFDEALKFIDARMPLDRRIYKRVRLVSAE